MNKIVNIFLLVGDKFMPEMHLKQPGFTYSACGPFTKTKKEFKKLYRQEIQVIYTKMILIKPAFNIIWLMVNMKIWLKEQNQTKS